MKTDHLCWFVGAFGAVVGAMMLLAPHQFDSPVYAAIAPQSPLWGMAFLLIGTWLLALPIFEPNRFIVTAVHLGAGACLLMLAYGVSVVGGWTGTANFGALGLATAVAPFLARPAPPAGAVRRVGLLTLAVGLGAALTGASILAMPDQFIGSLFDSIRPYLVWFGLAFLGSGLALAYVELRVDWDTAGHNLAHLATGATLLAFCLASSIPLQAWIGVAYYGGFGVVVPLLPWLRRPLRAVDPTSLRVRLAFALAFAATVPAVLVVGPLEGLVEGGGSAAAGGHSTVARDLLLMVLLVMAVGAAVAGAYVAGRFTAPLELLTRAAAKLAAGDATAPVPVSRVAEIGQLGAAFADMRDRLAARTAEREQLQAELRAANEHLMRNSILLREQTRRAEGRAAELDATFDAMTDAVLVLARDGTVIRANSAAQAMIGEMCLGKSCATLLTMASGRYGDGREVPREEAPSVRALRGERVEGERLVVRGAAGREHVVLVSASPLLLGGEISGAVVLWHDISSLIELDRLKDQFIKVAAHELKTPVTIMKGYSEALLRLHDNVPPQAVRMLEAIDRGADRINGVVRDLLDVAKLQSGQLDLTIERIDLAEMVEQVLGRVALTTSRHNLRVLEAEPTVVWGDRYRLEQVLANLLDNAVKHSPRGGNVDVAVGSKGDEAVVWVRDRGVGIPKDKQGRIFERFYRAHTRTPYDYGGMGTGLFISKEVITRHGGRMWFESEEGRGSVFAFVNAERPTLMIGNGPPCRGWVAVVVFLFLFATFSFSLWTAGISG